MWQISGWMAATYASLATGIPLDRFQVLYDVEGRIDGPSAGALLTVGVMAALKNEKLRADTTITGTINPDGTIGAVDGILSKIRAAIQEDLKIILVPAVQKVILKPDTEEKIDVVQYANANAGGKKGVQVIPVNDAEEAYQIFVQGPAGLSRQTTTGVRLGLEQGQKAKINELKNSLESLYLDERKKYESLRLQEKTARDDNSREFIERAISLAEGRSLGSPAADYDRYLTAVHAAAAARYFAEMKKYRLQGHESLMGYIKGTTQELEDRIHRRAYDLNKQQPSSPDYLVGLVEAAGMYTELLAVGDHLISSAGRLALASSEMERESLLAELSRDLAWMTVSEQAALHTIEFGKVAEGGDQIDPLILRSMAETYRSSGQAYKELLEVLKVEPGTFESSQINLLNTEIEKDRIATSTVYFYLGSALFLHNKTYLIVTQFITLKGKIDVTIGSLVLPEEQLHVLPAIVDLAQTSAEAKIHEVKRKEAYPFLPLYYYELGMYWKNHGQTNEDRLRALDSFWKASNYSTLIKVLTPNPLEFTIPGECKRVNPR
jgi:hypothetical protein